MAEPSLWHNYFSLSWADFFFGTPFVVDAEEDLSHKRQLLDLLITRGEGATLPRPLPDGFDDLGRFNLITFKSHREALDGFALNELVGHYVNLIKQSSDPAQPRLPESEFRGYAVCARYPHGLPPRVRLERVSAGVYRVWHFSGYFRVIVIARLPRQPHNAMLHLFSADQELVKYGAEHYRPHSPETSTLLQELIARYSEEGEIVAETLEQFGKRSRREMLQKMTPEELLEWVPDEKRLEGISAEKRLEGISDEELARILSERAARKKPE